MGWDLNGKTKAITAVSEDPVWFTSHPITCGWAETADIDFACAVDDLLRQRLFGVAQVVGHLQVHPEFRRCFEKRSQPNPVSPMIPLSSFRIAVIRLGGTPIAFANTFAVRPSGFKNS